MRGRMVDRLAHARPMKSDSGWMRDYLVAILRGCYYGAAAWQMAKVLFAAGLASILVPMAFRWLRPRDPAAASAPGRRRWVRRGVRAALRGMGLAAVPAGVSLVLYALGVFPSPSVMALAGLALAAAWCGLLWSRRASRAVQVMDLAQAAVSIVAMCVIVGAMY